MKNKFHYNTYQLTPDHFPEYTGFIEMKSILTSASIRLNTKEKKTDTIQFNFNNYSRDLKGEESDLRNRVRSRRNP